MFNSVGRPPPVREVEVHVTPRVVVVVVNFVTDIGNRALTPIQQIFNPTRFQEQVRPSQVRVILANDNRSNSTPIAPPHNHRNGTPAAPPSTSQGSNSTPHGQTHSHAHVSHKGDNGDNSSSSVGLKEGLEGKEGAIDQNGEEGGKRAVDQLAKEIVNRCVPEKFNFLIQTISLRFPQLKQETPLFKGEKSPSEDNAQKAPASRSQAAARGEAKTVQQPHGSQEIDPVEKSLKGLFQHKNAPAKGERNPHLSKAEGKESGIKPSEFPNGGALPFTATRIIPKPENFVVNLPSSDKPLQNSKDPSQPVSHLSSNSAQAVPRQQMAGATPPMNPLTQPQDPLKASKGHLPLDKIQQVQHKHVQPRRDAIVNADRNDNQNSQITQRQDDKHVVRIPILPDMPLSREGILKDSGTNKTANLKEDDGYRLGDVVLMMLCAVICNARTASDMIAYLTAREQFFTAWLGLKNGLPSYRLLTILLRRFNPHYFDLLIQHAIGKKASDTLSALRNVGVWESDRGIVLAELKNDFQDKRYQPPLLQALEVFDLSDAILTIDSDKDSSKISRKIKEEGADYLVALKGKHGVDYERAAELFSSDLHERGDQIPHETYRDVNQSPSIATLREITVAEDVSWVQNKDVWAGLKTVVQMVMETVVDNRTVIDKRLYLSSMKKDPLGISLTLRCHSTLEARALWLIDLDFTRGKADHSLENFDQLRKCSWDLLNFDVKVNGTVEAKRRKAVLDNTYLSSLFSSQKFI